MCNDFVLNGNKKMLYITKSKRTREKVYKNVSGKEGKEGNYTA